MTTSPPTDKSSVTHPPSPMLNLRRMKFSMMELSGSLGDLGTFIPLTLALAMTTSMDLGTILIFAGLANIVTGILFGLPVPVQPMKAIAAVAIAEQLLPEEIAAAGIVVGAVILVLGATKWTEKIDSLVPRSVIRGIQLGVGIKLAAKGISMISATPLVGMDSITMALALGLMASLAIRFRRIPSALIMFAVGLAAIFLSLPATEMLSGFSTPDFNLITWQMSDWTNGILLGAVPQLPLTLLNSVLAVCALSGDLFPRQRISTSKMAISVGIMNLIACPFGAMPMCHGSGGLAGQYHFGARTGGSVLVLGSIKLIVGAFFGVSLMTALSLYPMSILGLMLIMAGIELAKPARDQTRRIDIIVMLVTVAGILAVNTAVGFAIGLMVSSLIVRKRGVER